MSALDGWVDVCRTGLWTDANRQKVIITEAMLDGYVAANATQDAVPVVIGHPEQDAPAYGWVSALRRSGDRLQAQFRDLDEGFRAAVEAGRYVNRSIAIKGGALRHVGFLGARLPAVSGLAPTRFASPASEAICLAAPEPSPASERPRQNAIAFEARALMSAARDAGETLLSTEAADIALARDGGLAALSDPSPGRLEVRRNKVIAFEARALEAEAGERGQALAPPEAVALAEACDGLGLRLEAKLALALDARSFMRRAGEAGITLSAPVAASLVCSAEGADLANSATLEALESQVKEAVIGRLESLADFWEAEAQRLTGKPVEALEALRKARSAVAAAAAAARNELEAAVMVLDDLEDEMTAGDRRRIRKPKGDDPMLAGA